MGISRLMDIIADSREAIRNDVGGEENNEDLQILHFG